MGDENVSVAVAVPPKEVVYDPVTGMLSIFNGFGEVLSTRTLVFVLHPSFSLLSMLR